MAHQPPAPPKVEAVHDLRRRVALVTGASRGIGRGIVERLAEAGARVMIDYRSNDERAEALRAELGAQGRQVDIVRADVSTSSGAELAVARTVERFGAIDTLVNNAGIYPLHPLLDMTEAQWSEVVDCNLKSVFLCTQAAARAMIAAGRGGAIVNVASIEAFAPARAHSHYSAAKAGVVMHTRASALELGQYGIRVNAVAPGLISYPELEAIWPEGVARFLERAPLGRLGAPHEVADACMFLISSAASFITGAVLPVDGGVTSATAF